MSFGSPRDLFDFDGNGFTTSDRGGRDVTGLASRCCLSWGASRSAAPISWSRSAKSGRAEVERIRPAVAVGGQSPSVFGGDLGGELERPRGTQPPAPAAGLAALSRGRADDIPGTWLRRAIT